MVPSRRGELEITEAIGYLMASGRTVTSTVISGYWKDTGNVADMLEVNRMVLESVEPAVAGEVDRASELIGRVVIEAGARVTGSRIVGPVIIGAGTEVTGSYIGPFTSVAAGCVIADSEIEYSIVLAGASIRGVRRIEASLIGHHATSPRHPRSGRRTGSSWGTTARCRSAPNSRRLHEDPGDGGRRLNPRGRRTGPSQGDTSWRRPRAAAHRSAMVTSSPRRSGHIGSGRGGGRHRRRRRDRTTRTGGREAPG